MNDGLGGSTQPQNGANIMKTLMALKMMGAGQPYGAGAMPTGQPAAPQASPMLAPAAAPQVGGGM